MINVRKIFFRIWYSYVNRIDTDAEVLFMNYGYHDEDMKVDLDDHNDLNKYSIQLYHHLAIEADLKDKDIVEIGCGRGGGLSYITKTFKPKTACGIDLDKNAVKFCRSHYKQDGLSFRQGNAQDLDFEYNSCDVLINVESSHRYPDMSAFLSEVKRVLRPGGYFLLTDFRYDYDFEATKLLLETFGMTIKKEININDNVIDSLDLSNSKRIQIVKKLTPRFLHKTALSFAGTVGSETYNMIKNRKYIYFTYIFQNS